MRDGLLMRTATMVTTMIVQSHSRIVHAIERTLNGRVIIQFAMSYFAWTNNFSLCRTLLGKAKVCLSPFTAELSKKIGCVFSTVKLNF